MSNSSIFDLDEFKPYNGAWLARVATLSRREGYYTGRVYTDLRASLGPFAPLFPKLYKGIKPLYLPLSRAVDVDAGIIPGGWTLSADAPAGADEAMKTVLAWSDWETDGVLFVHYGAQYGLTGLKVCDLRDFGRVLIKPIDPSTFMLVGGGFYSTAPAGLALIVESHGFGDDAYEYAEVITAESIRTYRNGQPWGYDGREPEYTNDLGFIPIVEAQHKKTGNALGESTFEKTIPMLDEVNEIGSYLADIIKKHSEPQWAATGVDSGDLVKSGDNVWFAPQGADFKALVAAVDISGVLSFVQEIRDQVHGSLPELAFDELVKKGEIATATLELQLMELTLKIQRCRPNYDHALADALRMAGRASAQMGLSGLSALDDESLHFDASRPVLPQDENEIETAFWAAARAAVDAGSPLESYLRRRGWSDEDIADYLYPAIEEDEDGAITR